MDNQERRRRYASPPSSFVVSRPYRMSDGFHRLDLTRQGGFIVTYSISIGYLSLPTRW
jgi:hypothetical protein